MKKIILVAAMVLGFAVAAAAQPRAIGLRLGNGAEVSYQHTMNNDFLSVDGGLGLDIYNSNNNALFVGATAIYNFMIAQPLWTEEGEWGFYAGPGANVGLGIGSPAHFNLAAAGAVRSQLTSDRCSDTALVQDDSMLHQALVWVCVIGSNMFYL